nr:pYEATS domain-containing protein [uncultured Duganella sp.]
MTVAAEYRIAQSEEYVGKDRWKWSCWIDAKEHDLDMIESVTWVLHPTFSPSRVIVKSRETSFRLDSGGWGTFMLVASLVLQDGRTVKVRHALKLHYPEKDDIEPVQSLQSSGAEPATDSVTPRKPKIFLSYSSEDEQHAQMLGKVIADIGGLVWNANSVNVGQPLAAAVEKMIRESDAVITLADLDYQSPWVIKESKIAEAEGKPVLHVPVENQNWSEVLSSLQTASERISDVQVQLSNFINKLEL